MSAKVFVPITDEILYDHPELITAPLRPFTVDQPCFRWLTDIEIIEYRSETQTPAPVPQHPARSRGPGPHNPHHSASSPA